MPRFRAILFDLDGTLLDDDASFDAAVARVVEDLSLDHPSYDFAALFETYRTVSLSHWTGGCRRGNRRQSQ